VDHTPEPSRLDCILVNAMEARAVKRLISGLGAGDSRGHGVLVDARDWRSGFISRADVADFLVKQIDDVSLLHKTPTLTG
jgi:hypothetical protein